jgi:hypothetical protein
MAHATDETATHTHTHTHKETKMKKTLTTYDIAHELLQDTNAAWTRAGAFALAEYLEEYEESTGEEMEMDIVAIRCDFSEYSSLEDWASDYGMEDDSLDDSHEERADNIRSFIQENGQLVEFDGGIIVSSF